MSVALPVGTIAKILNQFHRDPRWIASVVDQNGLMVARSKRHDAFVGKEIPIRYRYDSRPAGEIAGTTIDGGQRAQFFFKRSEPAGWRVTVGIPVSLLNAPSKFAMAKFATAGLVFLLLGGLVAHRFAGRLSHKMGALQTAAIVERKLSDEQFQVLAESVSNGILAVDGDGRIAFLNAQAEKMFGYSRDEIVGRPVEILIPQQLRARHTKVRNTFDSAVRAMGIGCDLLGLRKDGSEFAIKVTLNPIRTSAGELIMATMVDLTARTRAAKRLSATLGERDNLRRRLMQAQEQERLRLARDLHDETGQVVAAAMMELKGIEAFVDYNGRSRIRNLRGQLDRMGKALHRIAKELRPASIDQVGLAGTLADYVAEWSAQFEIAAEFFCNNRRLDRLSDEVSTAIYRIVQEALTNVAKHARGATALSVIVDFTGSELRLTIEDNGCGFETASLGNSRRGRAGLGLDGMRDRLSLIGGEFEIETSEGVGTTLFIRIPLEQERMIA